MVPVSTAYVFIRFLWGVLKKKNLPLKDQHLVGKDVEWTPQNSLPFSVLVAALVISTSVNFCKSLIDEIEFPQSYKFFCIISLLFA